jgi:hypothetical protein
MNNSSSDQGAYWRGVIEQLKLNGHPDIDKGPVSLKRSHDHEQVLMVAGDVPPGGMVVVTVTSDCTAVNDEHGATLHMVDGSINLMRPDGTVEITRPHFQRIEIVDIRLVSSYVINRIFDTILHSIEFLGGGRFACVFDSRGKVLESVEKNVEAVFSADKRTLRLYGTSAAES